MSKRLITVIFIILLANVYAYAQEAFAIKNYDVHVKVNKDASLNISEKILVHFTEERHGIIRKIPFKYKVQALPSGVEKANRPLQSGGYSIALIENIQVPGWDFDVTTQGDYKNIKIGSVDKYVNGDQEIFITYTVLNAINFFEDHSEFYFNVIGDQWATVIDSATFQIELYDALPATPDYFVATGSFGSRENKTETNWLNNKIFFGHTTEELSPNEALTVGLGFPKNFLIKQNYHLRGLYWIFLPFLVFAAMFFTWKKWGKDEEITIQTEFYPPENISPSVSGYIVDDKLDQGDLTALVPYWGAGGFFFFF